MRIYEEWQNSLRLNASNFGQGNTVPVSTCYGFIVCCKPLKRPSDAGFHPAIFRPLILALAYCQHITDT